MQKEELEKFVEALKPGNKVRLVFKESATPIEAIYLDGMIGRILDADVPNKANLMAITLSRTWGATKTFEVTIIERFLSKKEWFIERLANFLENIELLA